MGSWPTRDTRPVRHKVTTLPCAGKQVRRRELSPVTKCREGFVMTNFFVNVCCSDQKATPVTKGWMVNHTAQLGLQNKGEAGSTAETASAPSSGHAPAEPRLRAPHSQQQTAVWGHRRRWKS